MLVDTHCHLADPAFDADRDVVVARAAAAGVGHVVVIGESPEAAERAIELARGDSHLSATVGVHPHIAHRWSPELARWLRGALRTPEVVAAGEMGLDYHYDHSPRDVQQRVFDEQLAVAAECGLPAVIHAREADDDVAAILANHPQSTVILHSFSSGPGLLRAGVRHGAYVSLSGMITFRNWTLDAALREVPVERLLVETDAPYLAPVPHRGRRNEPAFVAFVASRVAQVFDLKVEACIGHLWDNAARIFGPRLSPRQEYP